MPPTMRRGIYFTLAVFMLFCSAEEVLGQGVPFEEALIDVGNVGVTVTNAGFVGKANVRNSPTGPPSFEYPLDSGVEHLFEAGLWIGAIRSDGVITVRTGAITASTGYTPGGTGYEFAQLTPILERSTLPTQDAFNARAVSHQDFISSFADTAAVLPGTFIEMPDVQGRLGAKVQMTTYAWNFPFTEYFAIVNLDIVNISDAPWDSVYVGMYHDLVVRNINTSNDAGGAYFNKNGLGWVDSLYASYAFNASGAEETINTYGAISFLGAEWRDPRTGQNRFFHPNVASDYVADGYAAPYVNLRWWQFGGGTAEFSRPSADDVRYQRMKVPYPNPANFETEEDYLNELLLWRTRLRTDGQTSQGNWIGLTPVGPFPTILPGDTVQVTFALTAALKPDEFQGDSGKPIDTEDSRRLLISNLDWARRTYAGEDNNFNGVLDPQEDANENGILDRYVIPEPPRSPNVRVAFEQPSGEGQRQTNRVSVYWDRAAERSLDPVSGDFDFEGYRIYRSKPGDDLGGNILDAAALVAQYDAPENATGFNNGFAEVELAEPVIFPDDTTQYWYRFDADRLLGGWQYLFSVTAFDRGDADAGLPSFESSRVANAVRVFPGTPPSTSADRKVGVYPNPYRVQAAWDGGTSRTRKINFYNLPDKAEIRVYTLAGEVVAELDHDSETYKGDVRWYDSFSADNRQLPGGEHSWDILSDNSLNISGGLYLYTVKNRDSGDVQRGKFVIIK